MASHMRDHIEFEFITVATNKNDESVRAYGIDEKERTRTSALCEFDCLRLRELTYKTNDFFFILCCDDHFTAAFFFLLSRSVKCMPIHLSNKIT